MADINDDYKPVIYKLPKFNDLFKHNIAPKFSSNIDYPKFSLGFHHYIHQNKDKMYITEEFNNKKKVYLVMNKFERYIDDYDESIGSVSAKYFQLDKKPNILSRAFYKLWELFFMFDLVPLDGNFISAHLAEGPGSFTQATMFFRDLYSKKGSSNNDKYFAVTLHSDNSDNIDNNQNIHIPTFDNDFTNFYNKESPKRIIQHTTYPLKVSQKSAKKDNGDLTDLKTILLFSDHFKDKKAHFISADGGFKWNNENTQEQEAFKLIFAEIVCALKIQAVGGHFVCKIFESFTLTTAKFLCILSSFYKDVFIVKPLTSRKSNSEKYIVCKDFIGIKNNQIDQLEKTLEKISSNSNKGLNLVDMYPSFKIPHDYITTIIKINTDISNRQLVRINEIIDFIQKQNYRGGTYNSRRNMQIQASKFWVDKFFPVISNFKNIYQKNISETDKIISDNQTVVSDLAKKLDK